MVVLANIILEYDGDTKNIHGTMNGSDLNIDRSTSFMDY